MKRKADEGIPYASSCVVTNNATGQVHEVPARDPELVPGETLRGIKSQRHAVPESQ